MRPSGRAPDELRSIRLTRRIAAAPALARYAPEEYRPGAQAQTDADLAHAARAETLRVRKASSR